MNRSLHIVCLDAPSPPDYGGAIDMFYKIVELSKSWRITLHYFDYKSNRGVEGLVPYCETIYAYKRASVLYSLLTRQPYIIHSRINKELINRLNQDTHPVLLEGIHCAGILPHLLRNRNIVIRMHNNEAEYYHQLGKTEKNWLKKRFHQLESNRLKSAQKKLPKDLPLACVSYSDIEALQENYDLTNLYFIPSFTPWQTLEGKVGTGDYCLYQGNMQVSENSEVAFWLIKNVFSVLKVPFFIAGKGISNGLFALAGQYSNVKLFNNPSNEQMADLITKAHVNILPSLNNTGLKLKLLHALFHGRHCLTNTAGIAGTAFMNAVIIVNTPQEYIERIKELMITPFAANDKEMRHDITRIYNNEQNAAKLNALLQTNYQ